MKYFFHPSAKNELQETVDYYEECQTGLGSDFLKEIYLTIQRILHFPEAWMRVSRNTRRCLLKRFPFGVIYQISGDDIYIIAIMQQNRKPDYWDNRIT